MEYIYAALLIHKAGQQLTEDNVKKVLHAAGVTADDGRVRALVAALDGVNIEETIRNAAAAPVAAAAPSGDAKPAAKEEKKEEVKEEAAAEGLAGLFG